MIACALIPRLPLTSALGDRREMLRGPSAVAPEPGGPQVIGEASGAAEAFGVRAGMRLAEALARCPALVLVPADPVRAEALWEGSLERIEGFGAAVEPARAGEAFFSTEPLRGLHGEPEMVLARARRALGPQVRLGAGPNRICAHAAAMRMRARRSPIVISGRAAKRVLAGLPVSTLHERLEGAWDAANVPDALDKLGVRTLGELAALPDEAVADRFGEPGLRALRLARGGEPPLRPRTPHEQLGCGLSLPEAASGQQLEHALGLLVDRLLVHPARAGRTLRRLRIEARLAGGGAWRAEVPLRSASANAERLRLALAPRLAELPGPATTLGLRALELGPEAGEQSTLSRSPEEERCNRVAEAVRQARAAGGRDAVMRVVEVAPGSRVPERRAILAPFSEERHGGL